MATTMKNLTEAQIGKLRAEAHAHGDYEMGAICDLALTGEFDRDEYTALSRAEANRVSGMGREGAYAAVVRAINNAEEAAND